ncbi:MAG: Gfo/Idh/MocA family oxidoreductase [Kiritimatiellaeota bacterium]|nr:Gfo/Idh/MocA family oxidoreductase [Kiritimatiellota bacterium]
MSERKLRMGMIGGGGGFIGGVHRMAATLDNEAELVAGAFSSKPEKSLAFGDTFKVCPCRTYSDYKTMLKKEAKLPADERLDFIDIVVPNASHFPIAKACLEAGFNVVCEKPMTCTLKQAKELAAIVKKTKKVFVLTHNYTGYPMVKHARKMVLGGELGKINKVVVEYPQGWLAGLINAPGNNIAMWRMDPKIAGGSCCTGDLGTHCENLVKYITGLEIDSLCADLTSFIPGNRLEDDSNVLIRYKGGAKGILYSSQIQAGEENPLRICVYGTDKGIEWAQENPNYLLIKDPAGTVTRLSRGNNNLCAEAKGATRLPWGHPEGFIEAFANLYREAYRAIRAEVAGEKIPAIDTPNVIDGVDGVAFLETVLASNKSKEKWTKFKK